MNVVWVLIALVNSGHWVHSVVPTLEFDSEGKCKNAVIAIERDTDSKIGTSKLRCVRIEK